VTHYSDAITSGFRKLTLAFRAGFVYVPLRHTATHTMTITTFSHLSKPEATSVANASCLQPFPGDRRLGYTTALARRCAR